MELVKHRFYAPLLVALLSVISCGCSINQLTAKASMPLIEGGVIALNREQDLQLAKESIPANMAVLEALIVNDPNNVALQVYAAQAYYGYAYGFIEDENPKRASDFYLRGMKHGFKALSRMGLPEDLTASNKNEIDTLMAKQGAKAVPALFWTASAWAKWIDMNRDKPASASQFPKAAALMQRVLELNENFYYAGPHIFFGVFYGGVSAMLGGDLKRSQAHFDKARTFNQNRMLMVDLLEAEFLHRQAYDQKKFHDNLTRILAAPDDLLPELAIANQIAKAKAKGLLAKEAEWF